MKTTTLRKLAAACLTALLAFGAMADDPVISQVTVRQRWPWSRLVDIDYVLTCDATQRVDVALTAHDGSTPLTLPPESLTGDIYGISHGLRRIVWDPMKTAYTNNHLLTQFRVALMPSDSSAESLEVLYKIISLSDGSAEDVTRGSLLNGNYGSVVTDFGKIGEGYQTSLADVLIWTGVTNNPAYKTDYLVVRKIPANTFQMRADPSSTPRAVTFSNDFWIGVFEMTQGQWAKVTGSASAYAFRQGPPYPVGRVAYDTLRGATNAAESVSINWPATGYQVGTDSFLAKLRNKTNGLLFDLPTEAQWECACRAGTATHYHDGKTGTPPPAGSWGSSNDWLNVLGRYRENGGYTNGIVVGELKCGSYRPNAYGLYDMHGNEAEWCLDWYTASLGTGSVTEPNGPISPDAGKGRILRGGSWYTGANPCTSGYRENSVPLSTGSSNGFRVVLRFE
jgi:formylglycine-generating enzyme required for sulfatase activity